jgi:molybdenum-dependent DNA-binding transcriptional regulator ModE
MGSNVAPFAGTPKPLRARHDGFTPARQRKFFKALKKTGCIADACRACGISRNTVRRHRDKWPDFDSGVEAALAIASVELDMIAWQRATVGAEEKVWRDGKLVMTRIKPSDAMLRLLMQGANPKKYGRTGQMPKGAALKQLKRQAEKEVAATLRASEKDLTETLMKKLDVLHRRRLAQGYSEGPDGCLVPPGWKMVPDMPALSGPESEE